MFVWTRVVWAICRITKYDTYIKLFYLVCELQVLRLITGIVMMYCLFSELEKKRKLYW